MNDWEQRYQKGETGWDRGASSPAIEHWLSAVLQAPARILIPGCGRGHEVLALAAQGFDVTAIDIAPSAVTHLKQQLAQAQLQAEVILGDLFNYAPETPFDVVYEQTCLCAIRPEQRAAYEKQLYGWLKPGGRLLALFMQTGAEGGPPFHCDVQDMRELFPASRWQWPQAEAQKVPHHNGRFELGYTLMRR
ncbi:MAG: methyltransferase domain-containing protein [Mariprofundaceae bacterium]